MSEFSVSELQQKRKTRFPIARVKKLIQKNDDVGKTSATVPVILSKAVELLFIELIEAMVKEAKKKDTTKIQIDDLKEVILKDKERLSFLKNIFTEENVE